MQTLTDPNVYSGALHNALNLLPVYLFAVYVTIYFILPKYLAKRNILFLILSVLSLITVTMVSAYFISIAGFKKSGELWSEIDVLTALYRCIATLIAITSIAVIIKIMKDYSLKQRENEMLVVENGRSKLQLLKMQMHPRILFECLHKIYDDIDAGTHYAPEMILKLSDLLSYLLYKGELEQVPLTEEIKMMQTYLELKKFEYKDKINIDFEMSGEMTSYSITPVLFLPLLETGIVPFDKLDKVLTVSIELKITGSKIYFNFKNNVPGVQIIRMPAAQTALDSTKKRLQMSHLNKFKIEFQSTSNSFAIMLQLEPDKFNILQKNNNQNNESLVYEHT